MTLTAEERGELEAVIRRRSDGVALDRRARCVLVCAGGGQWVDIRAKLARNDTFVTRRTRAFELQGLAGLVSPLPGRALARPVAKLEARVLNKALKHRPTDGPTHWGARKLAVELSDVSFAAVRRIWRKHGLQDRRLESHLVSDDPNFETKAVKLTGLYLDEPAREAVLFVDEKSAIQALDRKDRMLPQAPARAKSHDFEHKRNGSLGPFAALNTAIGGVMGMTALRHTSEQSVGFLVTVLASQLEGGEIHVICDNVGSSKTELVPAFLAKQCSVQIQYTLTYSSWLNQGENWFSRIQLDATGQGHLHVGQRLGHKAHALHPTVQRGPQTSELEARQPELSTPPIHLTEWTSGESRQFNARIRVEVRP